MKTANSLNSISSSVGTPALARKGDLDLSELSRELSRAVRERWEIAPVSARSKFASLSRSLLATPSNDPSEIIGWAAKFPEANYCVRTGTASRLLVLEVEESGQDSLSELCDDRWDDWTGTLKFNDGSATWLLYQYPDQHLRHLCSKTEGIHIHASDKLVFLPPSHFVSGPPLKYMEMEAKVLECPLFLLETEPMSRTASVVIPFPTLRSL